MRERAPEMPRRDARTSNKRDGYDETLRLFRCAQRTRSARTRPLACRCDAPRALASSVPLSCVRPLVPFSLVRARSGRLDPKPTIITRVVSFSFIFSTNAVAAVALATTLAAAPSSSPAPSSPPPSPSTCCSLRQVAGSRDARPAHARSARARWLACGRVLSSCVLSSCVLSSCVLSSCVLSSCVLSSCVRPAAGSCRPACGALHSLGCSHVHAMYHVLSSTCMCYSPCEMPSADAERFPLSPAARFLSRLLYVRLYARLYYAVLSSRAISLVRSHPRVPTLFPPSHSQPVDAFPAWE